MRILEIGRDPQDEIDAALAPPERPSSKDVEDTAREIIADVRARGDEALLELGQRFDSPHLTTIAVSDDEFQAAYEKVEPKTITALQRAKANIEDFHKRQLRQSWVDVKE
jgi:histidinol dehydrogenase